MAEVEIIDSPELARRWQVPESWIRSHTRARTPKDERIPCVRFGVYVRFEWSSPALDAWLARHREGAQEKPALPATKPTQAHVTQIRTAR